MTNDFIHWLPKETRRKLRGRDIQVETENAKKKILADHDIQKFLKDYKPVLNDDSINKSLTTFNGYTTFQRDPRYIPTLFIVNGLVTLELALNPDFQERKLKEAWKRKLDLSTLSIDNQLATLEDYDQSELGRQQAFAYCDNLIKSYRPNQRQVGIWLVGSFGIGKTYLLSATAKELNSRQGVGVTMIECAELIEGYFNQMKKDSSRLDNYLNKFKLVDCLIIDDIGAESYNAYALSGILYPIINFRYKKNKLTCFTSNLTKLDYCRYLLKSPKNGKEDVKRLLERIDGLATEVQAIGVNRREKH